MNKIKIFSFVFLFILLMKGELFAQSKQGYSKAGDECLLKNDPFCALNNYRLALDFGEDASLCYKMGEAEKLLHNYASALIWFQRCIAHQPEKEINLKAYLEKADLHKRLGEYPAAFLSIDSLKKMDASSNEKWNSLIADYKIAETLFSKKENIEVYPEPGDVNTAYSDFAPTVLGDSLLYYSSLRFTLFENNQKISTSRIASVSTKIKSKEKSKSLPEQVNMPAFNNANASISPDGKLMVFSRCVYDDQGKLNCALYESKYMYGEWREAVKLNSDINPAGKTSTQPNITTNKSEGYLLFFSSNKSSGQGEMDIWMSKRNANGEYEKSINAGVKINTKGDEWSPFYDIEKDSLYFASEKNSGLGGLDLYRISLMNYKIDSAIALAPPYNSGYNDLYYTRSYGENYQTFLVSNRPPAAKLNGSSCCYDIFRINPVVPPVDSSVLAQNEIDTFPKSKIEIFENLNQEQKIADFKMNFPIRLYFDNDYPDPRSVSSNTNKSYNHLAEDYLKRKPDYLSQQENDSLKLLLSGFFIDSVASNYQKLVEFTEKLYHVLSTGTKGLKISILGSASPLAERQYNLILSNRRIRSLENYWLQWKDDSFEKWIKEGRLQINFIPKGEDEASIKVSDQFKDTRKSVYSKDAAMERRIEIVDITLLP